MLAILGLNDIIIPQLFPFHDLHKMRFAPIEEMDNNVKIIMQRTEDGGVEIGSNYWLDLKHFITHKSQKENAVYLNQLHRFQQFQVGLPLDSNIKAFEYASSFYANLLAPVSLELYGDFRAQSLTLMQSVKVYKEIDSSDTPEYYLMLWHRLRLTLIRYCTLHGLPEGEMSQSLIAELQESLDKIAEEFAALKIDIKLLTTPVGAHSEVLLKTVHQKLLPKLPVELQPQLESGQADESRLLLEHLRIGYIFESGQLEHAVINRETFRNLQEPTNCAKKFVEQALGVRLDLRVLGEDCPLDKPGYEIQEYLTESFVESLTSDVSSVLELFSAHQEEWFRHYEPSIQQLLSKYWAKVASMAMLDSNQNPHYILKAP